MKKIAALERARTRIAQPSDNPAVRQARAWLSEFAETFGKLLWLCSFRLLIAVIKFLTAVIKGLYTGMTMFFETMARRRP